MQFVNPGFLWALGLISVPLIIHLFNFRKYKRVDFSNVSMLKQIETESRKTRQVKKWLVLLSRILAVICLVLAFSQPYVPHAEKVVEHKLKTIYIDNSFSMYAIGTQGQLFEEAKNVSRNLVQAFNRTDEIQILSNNTSSPSGLSKESAIDFIDNLEIGADVNDINAILSQGAIKAKEAGFDGLSLFYISDMQKTARLQELKPDSSVELNVIKLDPEGTHNLSIDSTWLRSPINKRDDLVELEISLSNHGAEASRAMSVVLYVNDIQKGAETFDIGADRSKNMLMSFKISDLGLNRCKLVINDPEVFFDNTYYFNINLKDSYRVLQLTNGDSPYSSLFEVDDQFELDNTSPLNFDHSQLPTYDMVILHDMDKLSSALTNQLNGFVEDGGVLFISPSQDLNGLSEAMTTLGMSSYGEAQEKELSLRQSDLNNPFFKGVYSRIPENTLMPKVKRLYKIQPTIGSKLLLSLKDGSPVLIQKDRSRGKIYQLALPTTLEWSNLKDHELFVLSVLQAAFSKVNDQDLAYSLDYKGSIAVQHKASDQPLVLVKDEQEVIVQGGANLSQYRFWLNDEIREAGSYYIAQKGTEEALGLLSLNYNRVESRQKYHNNIELKEWFGEGLKLYEDVDNQLVKDVSKQGDEQLLWKLFLILSLIFLLIEILLLRFIKS